MTVPSGRLSLAWTFVDMGKVNPSKNGSNNQVLSPAPRVLETQSLEHCLIAALETFETNPL